MEKSKYKLKRTDYGVDKSKYIDLKINGRLFPSWVLTNFKQYKLPEIVRKEGEDPCKITEKRELFLPALVWKLVYAAWIKTHGGISFNPKKQAILFNV